MIHNFRDIGGFFTEDGKLMKRGLYFRSDSLHSFSKNDVRKVLALQIRSIIDLRTPGERAKKLYDDFDRGAVQVINIPIYPLPDKKESNFIGQLLFMFKGKHKELNFEGFMFGNYQRMAMKHSLEINRILTFLSEKQHLPVILKRNLMYIILWGASHAH